MCQITWQIDKVNETKILSGENMNKRGNYEDCLEFIENKLNIHLLDFQKEIIKAYFENRIVNGGRGIGKTMCRNAYGKYIDSLMVDENHPSEAYVNK